MDILYYSNACPNCRKLLEYVTRNHLIDVLNMICIDKRTRDSQTGQTFIHLENGKCVLMPPNVQAVPALLIRKDNFRTIYAKDIISYLNPIVSSQISQITKMNGGEPMPMQLSGSSAFSNVVSEKFSFYGGSLEGRGVSNPNYASINGIFSIQTPDETYKPNKINEGDLTIDMLKNKRDEDIPQGDADNPYGF